MASQNQPRRREFKLPVKSDNIPRFHPLLEALADRDELNEVLKNRVAKACQLLDSGVALYPNLLAGVAQQPRLNQRDGFHPNAQGVVVIAQGLAPVLLKALAGRRA